jgi:hypothetical protein
MEDYSPPTISGCIAQVVVFILLAFLIVYADNTFKDYNKNFKDNCVEWISSVKQVESRLFDTTVIYRTTDNRDFIRNQGFIPLQPGDCLRSK